MAAADVQTLWPQWAFHPDPISLLRPLVLQGGWPGREPHLNTTDSPNIMLLSRLTS